MNTDHAFLIIMHDVAPPFAAEINLLTDALTPLVGRSVAGALVPRWHGLPVDPAFVHAADQRFGELLLHGLSHQRRIPGGPVTWLSGGADEFGGLSRDQAVQRVSTAQSIIGQRLGRPLRGFVPPAWQFGPLRIETLAPCGISYTLGFHTLQRIDAPPQPLATWSWDAGRIGVLGHLGQAAGVILRALDRRALPCVVLHPSDYARGFLPYALALIRALQAAGRRPLLPGDLE